MKSDNLDKESVPVKHTVTPSDLQQIQQRRIEAHAERQTVSGLNLLRAFKLGEALREMKE